MNGEVVGRFPQETHEGRALGVKIVVDRGLERDTPDIQRERYARNLMALGEAHARVELDNDPEARRVWVWLYSPDMEVIGPALATSYLERGGTPKTEFTARETFMLWYLGQGAAEA